MASGATTGIPDQVEGIPDVVLTAYGQAAASADEIAPECKGMKWSILAGIGQEESQHGLFYGGSFDASGTVSPPIIGVALDGGIVNDRGDRVQAIPDTDQGVYDRDQVWDRAVGPMQFIPSTWQAWAPQATGKEQPDPQNIFDASRAAVAYLCGNGPTDLNDRDTLRNRIRAYNNAEWYINDVIENMETYDAIPVSSGGYTGQASGAAATAIAWALQHEGSPYVWGGYCQAPQQTLQGRRGAPTAQDRANNCDCSSLMQAAYASAGITLGRTTWDQFDQPDLASIEPVNGRGSALTEADLALLQPGDMMYFFSERAPGKAPTHVGMYLGGTEMIHAPNSRKDIETISMEGYYMGGGALYYGSRRVQG